MNGLFSNTVVLLVASIICLTCMSCGNENKGYAGAEASQLDTLNSLFEELAKSYERSDRTAWQKPGAVIELMGNITDKTVADIGAGTGYFTLRLAQHAKKVIAVDIDTMALNYIDSMKIILEPEMRSKIETRLANHDDPRLSANEVDIVLMVNTYPFIPERVAYFESLRENLRPMAKVLIIDFKKKRLPLGPPASQKVALNEIEAEMEEAGFELLESDDRMLEYQYVVLFRKSAK